MTLNSSAHFHLSFPAYLFSLIIHTCKHSIIHSYVSIPSIPHSHVSILHPHPHYPISGKLIMSAMLTEWQVSHWSRTSVTMIIASRILIFDCLITGTSFITHLTHYTNRYIFFISILNSYYNRNRDRTICNYI